MSLRRLLKRGSRLNGKERVQLPLDWFGTPIELWWRHLKTHCWYVSCFSESCNLQSLNLDYGLGFLLGLSIMIAMSALWLDNKLCKEVHWVCTNHIPQTQGSYRSNEKPAKSWNFMISFSRPGIPKIEVWVWKVMEKQ